MRTKPYTGFCRVKLNRGAKEINISEVAYKQGLKIPGREFYYCLGGYEAYEIDKIIRTPIFMDLF